MLTTLFLTLLIFITAFLYASVGHAGASGYLAAMALFGVSVEVMKPTALALNILVATIATLKFYRAGCFSWPLFWPFALSSLPFSFLGGSLSLPSDIYNPVVGLVLLYAAYRLLRVSHTSSATATVDKPLSIWLIVISGASIGLLSGLTGVGGGIFLSPLLLFTGTVETRQTAGVSAAFILVNSIAGLLGHWSSMAFLPSTIPLWAVAAGIGGYLGAEYGSQRFGNVTSQRLLAVVLIIAGGKMILLV